METEKLTLEHLAPYLPYGVEFYCPNLIWSGNPPEPSHEEWGTDKVTLENVSTFLNSGLPLILRPMSDLLKWIKDDKGRKIFPAQILWSVDAIEEERWNVFGFIPEYWQTCVAVKPDDHEYRTFKYFLGWHFDVFGLIEKGLAININTIEQK